MLLHVELDRSSLKQCICSTSSRSQGKRSTEWLTWISLPVYPGNIFYLNSQGSRISTDCLETSIKWRALPRNSLGQRKKKKRKKKSEALLTDQQQESSKCFFPGMKSCIFSCCHPEVGCWRTGLVLKFRMRAPALFLW